jgi:hypothetical protein
MVSSKKERNEVTFIFEMAVHLECPPVAGETDLGSVTKAQNARSLIKGGIARTGLQTIALF